MLSRGASLSSDEVNHGRIFANRSSNNSVISNTAKKTIRKTPLILAGREARDFPRPRPQEFNTYIFFGKAHTKLEASSMLPEPL